MGILGGIGVDKDYKCTAFQRADGMDATWRTGIRREDGVGRFFGSSPHKMTRRAFYETGNNYQMHQKPSPPEVQHKLRFVVRPASEGILDKVVRTKYGYLP